MSVWEFFWPLLVGARLVMARPEGHRDSAYLVQLIAEQGITTLHFVPSMLQVFLEAPGLETCRCLRQVMCSGEVLPVELQKRFFERLDVALHNLYGPTEAAVDVIAWVCQADHQGSSVPIGRPIANIQIYILDTHLQPVPIGVAGELYIGGVGVARGYLNQPQLTAKRFIPHPLCEEPTARVYKTGDLARYLPDGNIEFLGRTDYQVKMQGHRIELGEIEATLRRHDGVGAAVVIVREETDHPKRLVAYVVPTHDADPTSTDLREFLKKELPPYMIPSTFVMLAALPLSAHGKVDRLKLPAARTERPDALATFVAPRNPTEQLLAQLCAQALQIDTVGIHDNLFEL